MSKKVRERGLLNNTTLRLRRKYLNISSMESHKTILVAQWVWGSEQQTNQTKREHKRKVNYGWFFFSLGKEAFNDHPFERPIIIVSFVVCLLFFPHSRSSSSTLFLFFIISKHQTSLSMMQYMKGHTHLSC